jgi:tripartite-type tricarboxylate transporter receptor subunit TctC
MFDSGRGSTMVEKRTPLIWKAYLNLIAIFSVVLGCVLAVQSAGAQTSDFYSKNRLRFIVGAEVGGSYDFASRLISRHLGRFIPGEPSIMVQNMPGAGGLVAANHFYTVAPRDGSVVGMVTTANLMSQMFNEEAARFDAAKFNWIGNPLGSSVVTTMFYTAPVKKWQDALTIPAIMGATGRAGTDAMMPLLANATLGTKFKVVLGYRGGGDIAIAMSRGEVHGRGSQTWAGWKATQPDWVKEGKLVPLWQLGLRPLAELPNVPQMVDLISDADNKALVRAYTQVVALGRPVITPPGVPTELVEILRRAFDAMMVDPAFIADAEKNGFELDAIPGRELQTTVEELTTLDGRLRMKLKAILRDS